MKETTLPGLVLTKTNRPRERGKQKEPGVSQLGVARPHEGAEGARPAPDQWRRTEQVGRLGSATSYSAPRLCDRTSCPSTTLISPTGRDRCWSRMSFAMPERESPGTRPQTKIPTKQNKQHFEMFVQFTKKCFVKRKERKRRKIAKRGRDCSTYVHVSAESAGLWITPPAQGHHL